MTGSRFSGRVAIVTGASRGIGAALARALAAEGAAVACAARTVRVWDERLPGTVHDTVTSIEEAGGRAVAVPCDLTVEADVVRLAEDAARQLGPVDVLVNNAAVTAPGRPPRADAQPAAGPPPPHRPPRGFLDFPLKAYRLHFEVDVFAAYRLMQLVLPGMVDAGRGSVLNITSDASRRPGEGPWPEPAARLRSPTAGRKRRWSTSPARWPSR